MRIFPTDDDLKFTSIELICLVIGSSLALSQMPPGLSLLSMIIFWTRYGRRIRRYT